MPFLTGNNKTKNMDTLIKKHDRWWDITPMEIVRQWETFVVNQLAAKHVVEFGKQQGDFKIDGKYTIEVGGEDKDFSQIANVPNSYVLADNLETAIGHKLPIWVVGFLY